MTLNLLLYTLTAILMIIKVLDWTTASWWIILSPTILAAVLAIIETIGDR